MPDTAEIAAISQVTEVGNTVSAIASVSQVTEIQNTVSAIASVSQVTEIQNTVSAIAAMSLVVEVSPQGAQAVISDVNGAINTPVTFDGSNSSGDSFGWAWTSVPAGSAFGTPGPVLYPDDGASTPIDMTDNEVLLHFGNNLTDNSGNSRTVTSTNTSFANGFDGTANGSLSLNSTNSRAEVSPRISLSGNWTIAFWFYNLHVNTTWRTGAQSTDSGDEWPIIVQHGGNLLGVYADSQGGLVSSGFSMPSADYQGWHHIAAVGSGSTTTFYVNGVNVGSSAYKSASSLRSIGGAWQYSQKFADRIDEAAVWSRALSASEIADIYSKQSQVAGFVDLGLTSSGTATLYPDNGAATPIDMANNRALLHFNGNTTDTSGNGITVTTTDTSFAAGFDGTTNGSLALNSDTSRALLSPAPSLSGGNWTVAFWFYNLKPNVDWRTGLRGSNVDHQIIVEYGSDRLGVYANNNGDFRPSGFNMPYGTYQGWHHIVAVGSGTTTAFYVDGAYVGASDRKSTDNIYAVGNGSWSGAHQLFSDRIDEFAIWTRALSATEIASIYSLQSAGKVSITSSATFTPDVTGTYQAQFTAFKGAFADTVTVTANIAEPSTGLPSRALAGGLVGATTLSYASFRPGSLLPFGMTAAITGTASSPAEEEEEDDMKLIYSTTLTSDAATISTGTLPTGYRSLIIDAVVCADSTGAGPGTLEIEFNGDNQQSNYQYSRAYWRNSIVGQALDLPGAGIVTTKATSYRFAANRITIHNHEGTNNFKSYIVSAQAINSASDKQYYAGLSIAGVWENTDAITSVVIRPFAGFADFAIGSSIAVYGLK